MKNVIKITKIKTKIIEYIKDKLIQAIKKIRVFGNRKSKKKDKIDENGVFD